MISRWTLNSTVMQDQMPAEIPRSTSPKGGAGGWGEGTGGVDAVAHAGLDLHERHVRELDLGVLVDGRDAPVGPAQVQLLLVVRVCTLPLLKGERRSGG